MKNMIKNSKGFTLIELLVVIAIIAVLSVAVILTLNPAELLKQARDSTRISDVSTLKSALSLYLADVTTPYIGSSTYCYGYSNTITLTLAQCRLNGISTGTLFLGTVNASSGRAIDVTGWLPVNFGSISSGAPIGNLPVDPSSSSVVISDGNLLGYLYAASSTGLSFKLTANMESTKYNSGSGNVENSDGGTNPGVYETGPNLGL